MKFDAYKKYFAIFIFVLGTFTFGFSTAVSADVSNEPYKAPQLSVPVPGMEPFKDIPASKEGQTMTIPWLAQYIVAGYKYFVGVAVILAIVLMMIGGFQWMTSGGNAEGVSAGKKRITHAVTGLGLALGSYVILFTINPDLIELKSLNLASVDSIDKAQNAETASRSDDAPAQGTGGAKPKSSGPYPQVTQPNPDYNDISNDFKNNTWCTLKHPSTQKISGVPKLNFDFFGAVDCIKSEKARKAADIKAIVLHAGRGQDKSVQPAAKAAAQKYLGLDISDPAKYTVWKQIKDWRSPRIKTGDGGASSHFTVASDGTVYQTVDEAYPGRHAKNYNAISIGIDIVYQENNTYTEAQYQALGALVANIAKRYNLPINDGTVAGHGDCELSGRHDPIHFDFEKLGKLLPGSSLSNSNHPRTQGTGQGLGKFCL